MLVLAGMQAGDGDLNGALDFGEEDGILTTLIGLATIKVSIKVLMTFATDAIASTLEQEEASAETVLTTSTRVQESQDVVLMPILALLKLIITAEEVAHLVGAPVSTTQT